MSLSVALPWLLKGFHLENYRSIDLLGLISKCKCKRVRKGEKNKNMYVCMYIYNLDLAVGLEKLYKHIGKFFLNNYGEFPYFSVKYHFIFTLLFLRDASLPIFLTLLHFWE